MYANIPIINFNYIFVYSWITKFERTLQTRRAREFHCGFWLTALKPSPFFIYIYICQLSVFVWSITLKIHLQQDNWPYDFGQFVAGNVRCILSCWICRFPALIIYNRILRIVYNGILFANDKRQEISITKEKNEINANLIFIAQIYWWQTLNFLIKKIGKARIFVWYSIYKKHLCSDKVYRHIYKFYR